MIKLVFCIRRRANLSTAEFQRYWLERHAPLVKSVAASLNALRYVQSHTVLPEINQAIRDSRGSEAAYDGITELWWRDAATLGEVLASPGFATAQQTLITDEATFIDLSHSTLFLTEEHTIFG